MEIARWFFVVFAIIYVIGAVYLIVDTGFFLIKWEISERKYWKQVRQEEEDRVKSLADEALKKEVLQKESNKRFEESIKKQIEEYEDR